MNPYKKTVVSPRVIALIARVAISTALVIFTSIYFSDYLIEYHSTAEKFAETNWWIAVNLYMVAFLLVAAECIYKFFLHLFTWHEFFDEIALMLVASVGAILIEEYMEGIIVMILYQIGEIFEEISVNRSQNMIVDTIDMRPKVANLVCEGGEIKEIPAEEVQVGDMLLVRAHEMFVVDGEVVGGSSLVDEASITGEFAPRPVKKGDSVYSGSTNQEGVLSIKATTTFSDSTTAKILKLVMESGEKKSKNENFIHRFCLKYTPCVFVVAILLAIVPSVVVGFTTNDWSMSNTWFDYIYLGLTSLVIACPCALVIGIPLTYFMGITLASRYGIIVKGGEFFDKINELSVVVFDKTGTLTTGEFSIVKENNIGISLEKFRDYIYVGETLSTHPIGQGIAKAYSLGISNKKVKNYTEIPGEGLTYDYEGSHILIGNSRLLSNNNVKHPDVQSEFTLLYLSVDGEYCGYLTLDDTPKTNSKITVEGLKKRGIKTAMLSGAKKVSAEYMGNLLGIDEVQYNLLPKDKIKHLERMMDEVPHYVAYVGDGANDAPAILRSDVGFAMGSIGSDAAVENADVVIMNDDPSKVLETIEIAKDTVKQMKWVVAVALTIKGLVFIAALVLTFLPSTNNLPMWVGDLADTGVLIICIVIALLLLAKKIKVE
ncbi:MAG: heavy metal translocating P-type ATPase [Coprobacillus sp.]|nr:heavy metal translocating P-type ATPase [Coprobacillus sp.]